MVKLNCLEEARQSKEPCSYCGRNFSDQLDHFLHSYDIITGTRELYWSIIVNIFDVNYSTYLYNVPVNELTKVIFGSRSDLDISDSWWQALVATWSTSKYWHILCYEQFLLIPAHGFWSCCFVDSCNLFLLFVCIYRFVFCVYICSQENGDNKEHAHMHMYWS